MTQLDYGSFSAASAGTTYRVTMKDCCVTGEFISALAAAGYDPDDGPGAEPDSLTFANGVTLTVLIGVMLEDVS